MHNHYNAMLRIHFLFDMYARTHCVRRCACKYVRTQVGMSRLSGLYTALNMVTTNICLGPPVCFSRWLSVAFYFYFYLSHLIRLMDMD